MAANDRVLNDINDLPHEQLAASKASRTNFTPGKPGLGALEENWPETFRIPAGTSSVPGTPPPLEVTRRRISKVGRNIICDTELAVPVVEATIVSTVTDSDHGTSGTHTYADTETMSNPANAERFVEGSDWAEGA